MRSTWLAVALTVIVPAFASIAWGSPGEPAKPTPSTVKEPTCQELFQGALSPVFQPLITEWVTSKHGEQLHPTIRFVYAERTGTIGVATETRTSGRDLLYAFWFKWENGGWKLVQVEDSH